MRLTTARTKQKSQSGAALLLCLFALLLLSGIGMLLYMSSGTEARIATNYRSNLDAYYSAKFGIQEVRDRVTYASIPDPLKPPPPPGGLADLLPQTIAGNSRGVLYVINPANGETVDPTDSNNRYFDDQLCHDYNSGVTPGTKCNVVPGMANWALPSQTSLAPPGTASALKWVRINMKTNRVVLPNFCVDQSCSTAPLDSPVCWDGQSEHLSPGSTVPACDANGMQNVYMLTALAVTPGLRVNSARRLLRSEVVAPSIRPPGAVTMDASTAVPVFGDGSTIPSTAIDGRPHKLDGTLSSSNRCSAVAALATDSGASTTALAQEMDATRKGIVNTANNSCNWDGSSQGARVCTPGLWWVRGTNSTPRFITTVTTTTTSSGGDNSGPGNDGDHHGSTITTTSPCDSSNSNCYTNLDLSAPQLLATSATMGTPVPAVTLPPNQPGLFAGGPGNQATGSTYQSPLASTLPNEITALNALVAASKGQANYVAVTAANLAPSYGSIQAPAVVVITDPSLVLQGPGTSLTGYGVLVVRSDLEINNGASLNWTGVVVVQAPPPQSGQVLSGNGQFKIGGGNGFINGALLLQPAPPNSLPAGTTTSVGFTTSGAGSGSFNIFYSCDAIDMAFAALPFKVVASSEVSF